MTNPVRYYARTSRGATHATATNDPAIQLEMRERLLTRELPPISEITADEYLRLITQPGDHEPVTLIPLSELEQLRAAASQTLQPSAFNLQPSPPPPGHRAAVLLIHVEALSIHLNRRLIIAVDFDGTLCQDRYPEIGEPDLELIDTLNTLQSQGHTLILNTCRRNHVADCSLCNYATAVCKRDCLLNNAIVFCSRRGLDFNFFNENDPDRIAEYGGDTRKISADLHIDDKAFLWNAQVQEPKQ
jgi:hypothetical protein